jgi:2-polyprenyl-3-methyl-5-hydroxy-6-metoxy-1,4-benzoquinol methylase
MATSAPNKGLYYEELAQQHEWDEVTNTFETDRRLKLIFNKYLNNIDLNGLKFLDGGSGGGHFSAEAARRGADVTSLDVGEALLDQVARRCQSTRVVGSILDIPFENHSFDVVMSSEVIEHTDDPKLAIKELARVLRPNGYIIITSPGKLWQPVVRAASALKVRRYQGNENFLWPRTAARTLRACGIEVLELSGFNILPLFSPTFAAPLKFGDLFGKVAPSLYVNYALFGRRSAS